MHRYLSPACRKEIMQRGMAESCVRSLVLHGGERCGEIRWEGTLTRQGGPATLQRRTTQSGASAPARPTQTSTAAPSRGSRALLYPNDALHMHVVYGADDGMVPVKGCAWLRRVLEGRDWAGVSMNVDGGGTNTDILDGGALLWSEPQSPVRLVEAMSPAVWQEVPDAGHDDVLFLEDVVGWFFFGGRG
ncbi:hypothetical protein C8R43DRAFT_1156241 [Mycena crocata]|nr:hypothetical protein C8R43DRAFT_1156241 [Mycena crocata]